MLLGHSLIAALFLGAATDVKMLNPFDAKSRPYFPTGAFLTIDAQAK